MSLMRLLKLSLFTVAFAGALHCAPPSLVSFSGGIFDLLRERWRTGEFSMEFQPHFRCLTSPLDCLEFRPVAGIMATARGSTYLYGGINFDLLFWDHILFAPGFAAGWYASGSGKNLGYPLEFRSGIELSWQFDDWRRLGIHFYHLSNASIGHRNPGEESLDIYYSIPIKKCFPFIKN